MLGALGNAATMSLIRKNRRALSPITKAYILANVTLDPITRCWNWGLGKDGDGYGTARDVGRMVKIHRKAYELWFNKALSRLQGCHTCDNRSCCNPWHVFAGTKRDNNLDALNKGRHASSTIRGRVARIWLFEEIGK